MSRPFWAVLPSSRLSPSKWCCLPPPPVGGLVGGAAFPPPFLSFLWVVLLTSLLHLGGAAFPLSAMGWCCFPNFLSLAWPPPSRECCCFHPSLFLGGAPPLLLWVVLSLPLSFRWRSFVLLRLWVVLFSPIFFIVVLPSLPPLWCYLLLSFWAVLLSSSSSFGPSLLFVRCCLYLRLLWMVLPFFLLLNEMK